MGSDVVRQPVPIELLGSPLPIQESSADVGPLAWPDVDPTRHVPYESLSIGLLMN